MSSDGRRWGRHRLPSRGSSAVDHGAGLLPTAVVPTPFAPALSTQVAVAQLVPGQDPPTIPTGPVPMLDDEARRRRRAEAAVRALQVAESRLTDQIRSAHAAGRTDGMRELLSRRLGVRARLEEARTRL